MSTHPTSGTDGRAFLGLRLYWLLSQIDAQGDEVLRAAKVDLPSRLSSTIALLHRDGPRSVTAIGQALGMSHQLVSHRLKALRARGLIANQADRDDRRRSVIRLTRTGRDVARRLERVLGLADAAYATLFEEIGVDLCEALADAEGALARRPLADRLADERS